MTDDEEKERRRFTVPLRKKQNTPHRTRYVQWLNQQTKPNQVLIKKGTEDAVGILPMSPTKATLLLAVYDGIIPASPVNLLQTLLQELPRNPRKGTIPPCQLSTL